ncbi:MAG TPA: anti-sigma factor antagonist, partial [Micromonosporaceae bacterium]|nr:anti-sigma factor antagonist [Micromonosporaceae bacterium]
MERPELSVAVRRTTDEAVLTLAGEIDMLTASRLSSAVNEVLA